MPVTARLSKKFYDHFGDDIANELVNWFNAVDATYQGSLKELNELNFARFDAKQGQRFAEQDAKWEKRFAEQDAKWEKRFAGVETNFAKLETRLEKRLGQFQTSIIGLWITSALGFSALFIAIKR